MNFSCTSTLIEIFRCFRQKQLLPNTAALINTCKSLTPNEVFPLDLGRFIERYIRCNLRSLSAPHSVELAYLLSKNRMQCSDTHRLVAHRLSPYLLHLSAQPTLLYQYIYSLLCNGYVIDDGELQPFLLLMVSLSCCVHAISCKQVLNTINCLLSIQFNSSHCEDTHQNSKTSDYAPGNDVQPPAHRAVTHTPDENTAMAYDSSETKQFSMSHMSSKPLENSPLIQLMNYNLEILLKRCTESSVMYSKDASNIELLNIHWKLKMDCPQWVDKGRILNGDISKFLQDLKQSPQQKFSCKELERRIFLMEVMETMDRIGCSYTSSYCGHVYLPITLPGTTIALECVEPWECYANSDELLPATKLRHKQLTSNGWNVQVLRYNEWPHDFRDKNSGSSDEPCENQLHYLQKNISSAYIRELPACIRNSWKPILKNYRETTHNYHSMLKR